MSILDETHRITSGGIVKNLFYMFLKKPQLQLNDIISQKVPGRVSKGMSGKIFRRNTFINYYLENYRVKL